MALMTYDFVGMKHVEGEKDDRKYSFDTGCFVGEWTDREVKDNSAKGLNVIIVSIPDNYKDVLNSGNLGKKVDLDTYYAKGRLHIAYARLAESKK